MTMREDKLTPPTWRDPMPDGWRPAVGEEVWVVGYGDAKRPDGCPTWPECGSQFVGKSFRVNDLAHSSFGCKCYLDGVHEMAGGRAYFVAEWLRPVKPPAQEREGGQCANCSLPMPTPVDCGGCEHREHSAHAVPGTVTITDGTSSVIYRADKEAKDDWRRVAAPANLAPNCPRCTGSYLPTPPDFVCDRCGFPGLLRTNSARGGFPGCNHDHLSKRRDSDGGGFICEVQRGADRCGAVLRTVPGDGVVRMVDGKGYCEPEDWFHRDGYMTEADR